MKELQSRNLPSLHKNTLAVKDCQVSVYESGKITQKTWIDNAARIKKAFPKLKKEWLDILGERLKEKEFTNERFNDAVNKMIDTCPYPEPTIAEILNYDHRVECLSQFDMMDKLSKQGSSIKYEYTKTDINGELYYVKNKDFKEYGFKEFVPKPIEIDYIKYEITAAERKETSEYLKNALAKLKERQ